MKTEATPKALDYDEAGPERPSRFARWHWRILSICLIVFAAEIGSILVTYPWRAEWELNWVPVHEPALAAIWLSPAFRGFVTGLGLLNFYVALVELYRLLRSFFSH